jgi:hypothetical protein
MYRSAPGNGRSADSVKALVWQLGKRRPAGKEAAEQVLRDLSPGQVDSLVAIARTEANKERREGRAQAIGPVVSPLVLAAAICFLVGRAAIDSGFAMVVMILYCVALAGLISLSRLLYFRFLFAFRRNLYNALALLDDARVIGPLAVGVARALPPSFSPFSRKWPPASRSYSRVASAVLSDAFVRDVAALGPEDHVDLTASEHESLQLILAGAGAQTALAACSILERAGNSRDLPAVRRIACGARAAHSNSYVREAAVRCLQTIEARVAEEAEPGTLLRASQPSVATDILVRPASPATVAEPGQLLRAAPSESSDRS